MEPLANSERKILACWYLWGLFPISQWVPRPTNNSRDLKSTSGNDPILTVTWCWNQFHGDPTADSPPKDSDFQVRTQTLERLFPQTLLPIQKGLTLMTVPSYKCISDEA